MERIIDTSNKFRWSRCERPKGYEEYNSDWFISPDGDMMNARSCYQIGCDELDHDDWFLHLSEKRWFDANTFIPTYFEACRRKGIQTVLMRISY
jgi:hypothetical protein